MTFQELLDLLKGAESGAQIDERRAEIEELIRSFIRLKSRIIDEIHELDDYRYVELLYRKYIQYMRLEEISCKMKKRNGEPYSYDHIAALHGEALKSFSEIIKIP